MCSFLKPERMSSLDSFVFIHFNDLRDETREEQCEYEVEEDAIEVQSDEEVDTEWIEKETIVID